MIGWQVNDDDEYMRTNIHVLSGIRTHGLSVQAIKAYASDRMTMEGYCLTYFKVTGQHLQAGWERTTKPTVWTD
jgi:hypothetical protein